MANSEPLPNCGDVLVVPFPYADKSAEKRRPALVVSSNAFNRKHGLLWVAMIISADNPRWDSDIDLPAEAPTGLTALSVIRIAKIATIEPARIVRVAGRITAQTAAAVRQAMILVIGQAVPNR